MFSWTMPCQKVMVMGLDSLTSTFSAVASPLLSPDVGVFSPQAARVSTMQRVSRTQIHFFMFYLQVFSVVLAMRNCICHVFQGRITPSYHRMQRLP